MTNPNKKDIDIDPIVGALGSMWIDMESKNLRWLRWQDGDPPIEGDPGFPPGWHWGPHLPNEDAPWIVIDVIDGRYRVANVNQKDGVGPSDGLLRKKTHGSLKLAVVDLVTRIRDEHYGYGNGNGIEGTFPDGELIDPRVLECWDEAIADFLG